MLCIYLDKLHIYHFFDKMFHCITTALDTDRSHAVYCIACTEKDTLTAIISKEGVSQVHAGLSI